MESLGAAEQEEGWEEKVRRMRKHTEMKLKIKLSFCLENGDCNSIYRLLKP